VLYLQDFSAGQVFRLGGAEVDAEAIMAFGRDFDPQVFHVDPVRARDSEFGGLIASGWHTVGLLTRLWVDAQLGSSATCGSPAVDEVRWFAPVRPGDRLEGTAEVLEARPSAKHPWRGTMVTRVEGHNHRGERVAHFKAVTLIRRRAD
jgi:acyl dehydratase